MIDREFQNVVPKIAHLTTLAGLSILVAMGPITLLAQSAAAPPLDTAFAVPTTKVLAIGSFTAKAAPSAWKPLIPAEMRQTAQLYLAGKIDQWYVKSDQSGVVFVLSVTDPKEAQKLLDKLPLGLAGMMEFQLIPIGPLSPLRTLLAESPK